MKLKIVLIILMFLLFPLTASTAPFLVCDPQIGVYWYVVYNLGNLSSGGLPAESDGSVRIDLATLPPGTYNVSLKACNDGGCSDAANFTFTRSLIPAKPTNIRILLN